MWYTIHPPETPGGGFGGCHAMDPPLYLLYLSASCLWWQAVVGIMGVKLRHAWRMHSRRMWRPRVGSRNSTPPPSAACSARRTPAVGVREASTAAPEAWHRSDTTSRAGTPRWPHTGGGTTQSFLIPHEAMPAFLSSFRLLAMASPHLDARRNLWL
jgi:hypothetical protein